MALKVLMLRKKIDEKTKALAILRSQEEDFAKREAELAQAIEELTEEATDEERAVVEDEIAAFEQEQADHQEATTQLENEVRELENELHELEAQQEAPEETPEDEPEEREVTRPMETRRKFFGMSRQEMVEFTQREDVHAFLEETRSAIREKRAITGVGNLIPTVMLGLLRENILDYSKLYRHVNVRAIGGEGRLAIMGTVPEAVWTDCCANLNELDLAFYQEEFDCWKVGGFYAVCNATLEDSDIDLAAELLTALAQAIGLALDKAILYGTGTRMPLGIMTRLAQTTQPSDYPATARPWVDLHTTNILTFEAFDPATGLPMDGVKLFAEISKAMGAAKGTYSRGEKVFVMNEKTYTTIVAASMSIDAAGAIVAGVKAAMPGVGGVIEVLNFIPDNVIIAGYFDLYTLVERAGQKFATSEHVRFLQDQTVFKGTARYDGAPSIAEGFVAIGLNEVTPNATMTFAPDVANNDDTASA